MVSSQKGRAWPLPPVLWRCKWPDYDHGWGRRVVDERRGGYGPLIVHRKSIGDVAQGKLVLLAIAQVRPFWKVQVGKDMDAGTLKVGLFVTSYTREKYQNFRGKPRPISSTVPLAKAAACAA